MTEERKEDGPLSLGDTGAADNLRADIQSVPAPVAPPPLESGVLNPSKVGNPGWSIPTSDVAGLCERFASAVKRYEKCRDSRPLVFTLHHDDPLTVGDIREAAAMLERQEREIERWQAEAARRTREVELTYSVQKRLTTQLEAYRAALVEIAELMSSGPIATSIARSVLKGERT